MYISAENFVKYFSKLLKDPMYRDGVSCLKEGDLYKLQTNNKIRKALERISRENHITIDEALVVLMKTASMLEEERAVSDKVTALYRQGSVFKGKGDFQNAEKCYNDVIALCLRRPYLNQRKGGAYFHLAQMAKEQGNALAHKTYLKLCLKFYPEHNQAKEDILDLYQ